MVVRDTSMVVKGSSRFGARVDGLRVCRGRGDVASAVSSFIGFRVFRGVKNQAVGVVFQVVIRGGAWGSENSTEVPVFDRTSDTRGRSLGFRVFRRVWEARR